MIELPIQPLVIVAGVALLIYTLGYSALVGLAVLFVFAPLQGWMFGKLIVYRKTQEEIVDIRVRLLTDIISNIRSVKLYAFERFFGKQVSDLRDQEKEKLRKFGFVRSLIMSTFGFLPILAAVCESLASLGTCIELTPHSDLCCLRSCGKRAEPSNYLLRPSIFQCAQDANLRTTHDFHVPDRCQGRTPKKRGIVDGKYTPSVLLCSFADQYRLMS